MPIFIKKLIEKIPGSVRAFFILLAFAAVAGTGFYIKSCLVQRQIDKANEKVTEGEIQITNSQINANVAEQVVTEAEKTAESATKSSEKAKKEADRVRVEPRKGVPLDEANRLRCEAYPGDCK